MAKAFDQLNEREILALAISLEEEDARIYGELSAALRASFPATSEVLSQMQTEESGHRTSLLMLYQSRFGNELPQVRRRDVRGFVSRPAMWPLKPSGPQAVRKAVDRMERETRRMYEKALERTTDLPTRQLLGDLAEAEARHSTAADVLEREHLAAGGQKTEAEAMRRQFVLQYVQPGLAGLMDGSVSTLAPLFAAAFATKTTHDAFLVGLAASVGAGISMAFAEALSDDGTLTGRGSPVLRGVVTGVMTTLGGIGHTLPYLLSSFRVATSAAVIVVMVELAAISWIRKHYMETPWLRASMQVVLGGALVFVAGILIGQS